MSTSRLQEYLSSIPLATRWLLGANIGVHAALFLASYPVQRLAISPPLVLVHGEYYRLVSSAFVHSGLLHIGMNMSTLLLIGRSLELQYGSLVTVFLSLWMLLLTGVIFVFSVW